VRHRRSLRFLTSLSVAVRITCGFNLLLHVVVADGVQLFPNTHPAIEASFGELDNTVIYYG
jgi:hypothetical protein